tara:strand:+ start:1892 stop:2419 length:528 start_codon:yes stop_codon:yes gene_type:complete
LEIYLKKGYNMTKEHYYTDMITQGTTKSGKPNLYYDQTEEQKQTLSEHISVIIGFFSERTGGFKDERDWKIYNQELGEPVIWASGRHPWNPSVRCLWAQLVAQMPKHYGNKKARFSKHQIDQFNRCVKVVVKLYNAHTIDTHKETASQWQINMVQLALKTGSNPFEEHFVLALKN